MKNAPNVATIIKVNSLKKSFRTIAVLALLKAGKATGRYAAMYQINRVEPVKNIGFRRKSRRMPLANRIALMMTGKTVLQHVFLSIGLSRE